MFSPGSRVEFQNTLGVWSLGWVVVAMSAYRSDEDYIYGVYSGECFAPVSRYLRDGNSDRLAPYTGVYSSKVREPSV